MKYHFRNLVFEGGGVKGIAYVGAMDVLKKKEVLQGIQRVGGTSAGAINATLFALGFTNAQTLAILNKLNFKNLMDDDWGVIRDTAYTDSQLPVSDNLSRASRSNEWLYVDPEYPEMSPN
ncbi:MAG: patatin-like phospholipase family protein [Deltaproteobacteria bacterium]|nr:patatin-like phospholipase family protein [Deltaproteobacteria bacterium]